MKNTQESNSLQNHCICYLGELFMHKDIERNSLKRNYTLDGRVASMYILPDSILLRYNGLRITR